eukprot:TRINITY_DN8982_c0_g1_i1.p1 TRINITY_DN8982_c0_g1~~TRINITY_DN8982_c0_g1_i1.p1  ORF type:complete len:1492 (-),score=227.39 TRINITY_DN8982_c0_g1_i1:132-3959(-)
MKSACNELKGLTCAFQCGISGLSFPLASLIHSKGYALLAESILPVGSDTLIYGSADGGKTTHIGNKYIQRSVRSMAAILNLERHTVAGNSMALCGDIEIHACPDERNYMLDFARIFPPEAPMPDTPSNTIFYNLLRPAFVRNYPRPLCSDGFSSFLAESDRPEMNRKLEEATRDLLNVHIPEIASRIERKADSLDSAELISKIHYHGINIRHLGRLRQHVESPKLRKLILTECAARGIKNKWRKLVRRKMEELKISLVEPYIDETFRFLKPIFRNYQNFPRTFLKTAKYNTVEELDSDSRIVSIPEFTNQDVVFVGDSFVPFITKNYFFFELKLIKLSCVKIGLASAGPDKYRMSTWYDTESNTIQHRGLRYILEARVKEGDHVGLLCVPRKSFVMWTVNSYTVGPKLQVNFHETYYPAFSMSSNTTPCSLQFNIEHENFVFPVDSFCSTLGLHKISEQSEFWTEKVKTIILKRFVNALTPEEENKHFDVRMSIDMILLLERFQEMTGVTISKIFIENFSGVENLKRSDVVSLNSRVSHLGYINGIEAAITLFALSDRIGNATAEIAKLLDAHRKLSYLGSLLGLLPAEQQYHWAAIWYHIAIRHDNVEERIHALNKAESKCFALVHYGIKKSSTIRRSAKKSILGKSATCKLDLSLTRSKIETSSNPSDSSTRSGSPRSQDITNSSTSSNSTSSYAPSDASSSEHPEPSDSITTVKTTKTQVKASFSVKKGDTSTSISLVLSPPTKKTTTSSSSPSESAFVSEKKFRRSRGSSKRTKRKDSKSGDRPPPRPAANYPGAAPQNILEQDSPRILPEAPNLKKYQDKAFSLLGIITCNKASLNTTSILLKSRSQVTLLEKAAEYFMHVDKRDRMNRLRINYEELQRDANPINLGPYLYLAEVISKSFSGDPEEPEAALWALKVFCSVAKSKLLKGVSPENVNVYFSSTVKAAVVSALKSKSKTELQQYFHEIITAPFLDTLLFCVIVKAAFMKKRSRVLLETVLLEAAEKISISETHPVISQILSPCLEITQNQDVKDLFEKIIAIGRGWSVEAIGDIQHKEKYSQQESVVEMNKEQLKEAVGVLTRASSNDPFFVFFGGGKVSTKGVTWTWTFMLKYFLAYGRVLVRLDSETKKILGVCVWQHPSENGTSMTRLVANGIGEAPLHWGVMGALRFVQQNEYIEHHLETSGKASNVWDLVAVGIDQPVQRQGYGSQLLQPILRIADKTGLMCRVVLTRREARPFYEFWGFQFHVAVAGKHGGPPFWIGLRKPKEEVVV